MPEPKPDDDFDAWYDDVVPPYRPKLLGRTWKLPGEVPAVLQLKYKRLVDHVFAQADPGAEVTVPDGFADKVDSRGELSWPSIIVDLTSQKQYDEWLDAGLTTTMEARVAAKLIDRYILSDSDLLGSIIDAAAGHSLGKAPAPTRGPRRTPAKRTPPRKRAASSTGSSKAGRPSKPAGKPSTDKTSASS